MAIDDNLTVSFIQSILDYDASDGTFKWKYRQDASKAWNTRWPGKNAGFARKDGYVLIRINNKRYLAHRLAWFLHHGTWPNLFLDHINKNPNDNRIENLRECTTAENGWNRNAQSNASTGFKNVNVDRNRNKYQVKVSAYGKTHWVGYFNTIEESIEARDKYLKQLHGKFASFDNV